MKILVLNSGSSSIKYQLLELPEGKVLAKGLVQQIGEPAGSIEQKTDAGKESKSCPIADHGVGLKLVMDFLTEGEAAPLGDVSEIGAVGHRVVHGGDRFAKTVLIDEEVVAAMEAFVPLAPLHNPPNLLGIRVAMEILPGVPQVGVFDTAFHQTMPKSAFLYALPISLYEDDKIRRYGFHGTSHRYVTQRAAAMLGKPVEETNLITCHLGNGSSIAAVKNGQSVDTSMGLTPLEGLVMGTRCGDLDPAIIFHLARTKGLDIDGLDKMLNKQSGLLGLSAKSNDSRALEEAAAAGDEKAATALEVFNYRIRKYIGAYTAALGRVDAIVFTAGIGENSPDTREGVCTGLEVMGVNFDVEKNRTAKRGTEAVVSKDDSPTKVLVIPTNEELAIALDTYELTH